MKIFIIGATGYIGRALTRHLLASGHSVVALVRSEEAAGRLPSGAVTSVRGDLESLGVIRASAGAADAVIYLALQGLNGIRATDTTAIAAVLQTLKGSGKAFVMTSGLAVYLGSQLPVCDEDSTLSSVAPAQAWRAEMEGNVLAAAAHKVRSIVIRPAIVYGGDSASRLLLATLAHARSTGQAFYIGDGANIMPVVHVEDLARAYELALQHAPDGTTLNVVGANVLGKDIAQGIAVAAGAREDAKSVTVDEAGAAVGEMAPVLAMDLKVSGLKMASLLGWSPTGPSLLHELTRGSLATLH